MQNARILSYAKIDRSKRPVFEENTEKCYEADIVTKGNLEISDKDNSIRLCPGDMVIRPADSRQYSRVSVDKTTEFTAIRFESDITGLNNGSFVFYRLNHDNSLLSLILANEIEANGGKITQAANNLFEALLIRCLNEAPYSAPENSSATIFRNALTYMVNNMNIMLSVPQIAHSCGICETTLKNAFKNQTGESVKKYYNRLKIDRASELLKSGINAKEVSLILGFSTLSYFSQFFKRETGCTIREYIKQK